ncbi:MAG: SOS response-associated peptidase [Saprospiraceae bacterium]|nr:SOS response-associated peptidase [Saprospiraceae bacterium]
MCGRYSFVVSIEKIKQEFPDLEAIENIRVSYNIAPTQHSYVITNDKPDKLQYLIWGLIPHWSNDGKNSGKLINARKESIEVKPSFRLPIRKRRCLVLADSFYEWKTVAGEKVPYRIFLKNNKIMAFAGLWDVWYDGNYAVKSFSIITTPANHDVDRIHDRMPVILPTKKAQKDWLKEQPLEDVLDILETPPEGILKMYRVSQKVNSPKNNSHDLHQELPEQPSLF